MATKDYIASYKGIGIETNVDFEAQFAGQNFDDIRALAAQTGLEALMLGEEALILGGNTSPALGVTNTPTLAASNAGGALASGTLSVICVALTLDGMINSTVVSGVQASITRTNADSSSDTFGGGAAQKSANATVAITGPAGSVTASVAITRGAFGCAWYWGAAGSEVLGAITTINSAVIAANAAGTQAAAALPSADNSSNALVFDGLLTQALQPTSGANVTFQPTGAAGVGTPMALVALSRSRLFSNPIGTSIACRPTRSGCPPRKPAIFRRKFSPVAPIARSVSSSMRARTRLAAA
jgi:hypothetical protein